MNKGLKILIVVLIVLSGYTGWEFYKKNKPQIPLNEFSIDNTDDIDQIFLADRMGNTIDLKKNNNQWILSDSLEASEPRVAFLLELFKKIEVRNPVPESEKENILKSMAASNTKCEIYINGNLTKTYYVGPAASDNYGTYMLLETPYDGISSEPFIVQIPGFRGAPGSRFFTNFNDWRSQKIYKYHPNEIKKITINNFENINESFSIEYGKQNEIKLYNYKNEEIKMFDSIKVKNYILNYKFVNHNQIEEEITNSQKNHTINDLKFFEVNVEDKKNVKSNIEMYYKELENPFINDYGDTTYYDIDHFYGRVNNKDFVKMQYFHMDRIIKPLSYFLK